MSSSKGIILVTGASGYVGGQIAREALEHGYAVRATARSEASARKIAATLPQYADRLSFAVVPDMTVAEAYEGHLDGVTAILHAASPFVTHPQDNVRELLEPAVKGCTAVLEAARRFGGGGVRRVVITSSHAAALDLSRGMRPDHVYSEADWNPATWDEAAAATDGSWAYCASKALAERAAWDWAAAHGAEAGFDVATVLPPWIFGPYAAQPASLNGLSESVARIREALLDTAAVPPTDFAGFADVREVAAAHVRALEVPEAGGQRFWVGQPFNYQMAADALRAAAPPALRARVPEGTPGVWPPQYGVDGSKAERVLGIRYRPLSETLMDTFAQILELEKAGAAGASA